MKKISFFVYDIFQMGGIEKVVTLIANELSAKYDVEIISLYKRSDKPFYKLNDKIKVFNILEKQLNPIKLYYPYLIYKTKRALKNYKTDVFICAGMGYVGLNIFMRKRSKYIAWEHLTSKEGKIGGIMWLGRVLSAKYADKIIVLTKKDMELNIKKFKTQNKIVQIYNPLEVIEQNADYNKESKLIVSAGRLTYQKGFDFLVDVATKVFEKHPDWEWHIYGDGEEKENLQKLIDKRNIKDKLILKGKTNKMNEIYKDYAMFVLTSRYEGLGIVLLESHFAKIPIVSFDIDFGPNEIIQDDINGYLIKPFNIDEMANKINYLIENPNKRIEMSSNTLKNKEQFKMENIITKWSEIIQ